MDGIVNILKPSGMTSHDVVSFVRRCTNIKKVGHTGTLDPQAVGVLPICIGKATKVADLLTSQDKHYRAEIKLGITTDTQDSTGEILTQEMVELSVDKISEVIYSFKGDINQVPPMYSAIKVKGQKLYELARKGIEIKREPRKVKIHEIKILDIDLNEHTILIDVKCSKGTYIRTLCYDIGKALGCGAHMSFLLRTKSGMFTLEKAVTVEKFEQFCKEERHAQLLVTIDSLFLQYQSITINSAGEKKAVNGNDVEDRYFYEQEQNTIEQGKVYRVYNEHGRFLCLSSVIQKKDSTFTLKLVKSFY